MKHNNAWRSGLLTAALGIALLVPTSGAKAATLADYLVQMVCDNGSGGHTNQDPYNCPSTRRKLNYGETLPYHKWNTASGAGQISDSFPITTLDGVFRVAHTFFFSTRGTGEVPYFDLGDPRTGKTGHDISNVTGSYVSFEGTVDPGAGWQPIWDTTSCSNNDSWVLAPISWNFSPTTGDTVTSLTMRSPECPQATSYGDSYTAWEFVSGQYYESGKWLDTVKSWHFSGNTVNSSGLELFYFTEVYGKTRWEAWVRHGEIVNGVTITGPDSGAVAKCPSSTSSGTTVYGTTTYYLRDCHDWSYIESLNTDWSPTNWHVDPLYQGTPNLLTNTHMACEDTAGSPAECDGSTYVCRTVAPWQRVGNINWAFTGDLQAPNTSANCGLLFNTWTTSTGQRVFQNQSVTGGTTGTFTYGSFLRTPSGAVGSGHLVIFQVDSSGGILSSHVTSFTVAGARVLVRGEFPMNANTTTIQLGLVPTTVNETFEFTGSWVARKP